MPNVAHLKIFVLNEMNKPPYAGHPSYQKMITSLKKKIFWPRLKVELINVLGHQ